MSVLQQLRELMPKHSLTDTEARAVAEQQAQRFLKLLGVNQPHVPGEVVSHLPRIDVQVTMDLPSNGSGLSFWDKRARIWRIRLRATDVAARQRFSLAHEFKHILDDPFIETAYPPLGFTTRQQRAEQICNHFAACLLMPRPWVKRAWAAGVQQVPDLAMLFGVSTEAMARRLSDLGLKQSPYRNHYFRVSPQQEQVA